MSPVADMTNDFVTEYAERSDDELLHLASQRSSLTEEAAAALDMELQRRNLTPAELVNYKRSVHHADYRESRTRRRKIFWKWQYSWLEFLVVLTAVGLICWGDSGVPGRYQFNTDLGGAAFVGVGASFFVVGGG